MITVSGSDVTKNPKVHSQTVFKNQLHVEVPGDVQICNELNRAYFERILENAKQERKEQNKIIEIRLK